MYVLFVEKLLIGHLSLKCLPNCTNETNLYMRNLRWFCIRLLDRNHLNARNVGKALRGCPDGEYCVSYTYLCAVWYAI